MRRREFISLLGGTALALPLASRAQQTGRTRRIATLWPFNETDADGRAALTALRDGLRELDWGEAIIESRWSGGNPERAATYAS